MHDTNSLGWFYSSYFIERYPKELHARIRLGDPTLVFLEPGFMAAYIKQHFPTEHPLYKVRSELALVGELATDPQTLEPTFPYQIAVLDIVNTGGVPAEIFLPSIYARVAYPPNEELPNITLLGLAELLAG